MPCRSPMQNWANQMKKISLQGSVSPYYSSNGNSLANYFHPSTKKVENERSYIILLSEDVADSQPVKPAVALTHEPAVPSRRKGFCCRLQVCRPMGNSCVRRVLVCGRHGQETKWHQWLSNGFASSRCDPFSNWEHVATHSENQFRLTYACWNT